MDINPAESHMRGDAGAYVIFQWFLFSAIAAVLSVAIHELSHTLFATKNTDSLSRVFYLQ